MNAVNQRKGILYALAKQRWIHQVIKWLGVYKIGKFVLRKKPIIRYTNPNHFCYRITSPDHFGIEDELFRNHAYAEAIRDVEIATFIDLGSNAGWFPVWLANETNKKNITGLSVDADPAMAAESEWHIAKNQFTNCHVIHGAVGCGNDQDETAFFINPATSQSSSFQHQNEKQIPLKGKLVKIQVPVIRISEVWNQMHGDKPVDLLKIDIEGSELDFMKSESDFLKSEVRRIVFEWHKWVVDFSEIDPFLKGCDFELISILDEDEMVGSACYQNTKNPDGIDKMDSGESFV